MVARIWAGKLTCDGQSTAGHGAVDLTVAGVDMMLILHSCHWRAVGVRKPLYLSLLNAFEFSDEN